jgi:hypothetical protein
MVTMRVMFSIQSKSVAIKGSKKMLFLIRLSYNGFGLPLNNVPHKNAMKRDPVNGRKKSMAKKE